MLIKNLIVFFSTCLPPFFYIITNNFRLFLGLINHLYRSILHKLVAQSELSGEFVKKKSVLKEKGVFTMSEHLNKHLSPAFDI